MTTTQRGRRWLASGNREDGQGLAEYALILALIAIAVAAILGVMGSTIAGFLTDIATLIGELI